MKSSEAGRFYAALLEAKDGDSPRAMRELLCDDIEFHTPRFFRPVQGADHVMAILTGIQMLLPDFTWTRHWLGESEVVLEFEGHLEGSTRLVHGIEVFEFNQEGRMHKGTVWLRPTSAHDEMGAAEDALIAQLMDGKS